MDAMVNMQHPHRGTAPVSSVLSRPRANGILPHTHSLIYRAGSAANHLSWCHSFRCQPQGPGLGLGRFDNEPPPHLPAPRQDEARRGCALGLTVRNCAFEIPTLQPLA